MLWLSSVISVSSIGTIFLYSCPSFAVVPNSTIDVLSRLVFQRTIAEVSMIVASGTVGSAVIVSAFVCARAATTVEMAVNKIAAAKSRVRITYFFGIFGEFCDGKCIRSSFVSFYRGKLIRK